MVIIGWILRVLVVLFVLRLIFRAVFGARARQRRPAARKPPERIGGALVRCEQCGTHVTEARTLSAGGHTFCSPACRDQFAAARRAG